MSTQDNCVCCAGPVGPQGIPGVQGPAGNQGPRGAMGNAGPAGPAGVQGIAGVQGGMGLKGDPGNMGPAGPQGIAGLKGDKGDKGDVGAAGIQGLQGAAGQDGLDGADGPQGPMGPQGLMGQQGPKGDCIACPCDCAPEFAEVYSVKQQLLAASPGPNMGGDSVLLENTVVATANIDVSNAATLGHIIINKAGWYDVAMGMCGALNPIPSPLPVWTLSLFKNTVIVPGSTFANMTLSPEQKSNEIVADVFVHCNVGDLLEVANTSINQITLTSPTIGTNAATNSAYLKIVLLKAD